MASIDRVGGQPRAHVALAPAAATAQEQQPATPAPGATPANAAANVAGAAPTADPLAASPAPKVVEVLNIPPQAGDPPGSQYVKLQDGRVYRRSPSERTPGATDFLTGGRGMDPQGNQIQLMILYTQQPNGAFERYVEQQVKAPNGDTSHDQIYGSWDADEQQVDEQIASREQTTAKDGTKQVSVERTSSAFAAGQRVKRETDIVNDQVLDAPNPDGPAPEHITARVKVHGTWDNGGRPIVDSGPNATIPVIDRTQSVKRVTPGAGLHTNRDRILTYDLHAAGPVNKLAYDPMKLVVRFEGNKDAIWKQDQYIERELKIPVDATGNPLMAKAEEVRNDDHQAPHVKALMQARIWGGFASNIAIIAGSWLGGALGGAARPLVWGGLAMSGAETIGEGHALATHRTDASWPRMAMSVYDTTWSGLYALITRGRGGALEGASGQSRSGAAALGLGGAGVLGHAAMNSVNPVGMPTTSPFDASASHLLGLDRHDSGTMPDDWRPVQTFDARDAVLGG